MPIRITSNGFAMLTLILASWSIEAATYGFHGRGHPPGWIAESLGSGVVVALFASIAWWTQSKRPRSLLPPLILAVIVSLLLLYGSTRTLY